MAGSPSQLHAPSQAFLASLIPGKLTFVGISRPGSSPVKRQRGAACQRLLSTDDISLERRRRRKDAHGPMTRRCQEETTKLLLVLVVSSSSLAARADSGSHCLGSYFLRPALAPPLWLSERCQVFSWGCIERPRGARQGKWLLGLPQSTSSRRNPGHGLMQDTASRSSLVS